MKRILLTWIFSYHVPNVFVKPPLTTVVDDKRLSYIDKVLYSKDGRTLMNVEGFPSQFKG